MTQQPAEEAGDAREAPGAYPETFVRALQDAVRQLGWEFRGWRSGSVVCRDSGGKECTFGLDNVYRRAQGMAEAEWPGLLEQHLSRLNRTKWEDDLYSVAHRLLVRIRQPFEDEDIARSVWWQALGESGVVVVLVVDHPETMTYVTDSAVKESGRAGAEWLEEALENLRRRTSPDMLDEVEEGSGVLVCNTGDAYDAARALVLECLLPGAAEHGCLLAVPNRDRLFLVPVHAGVLRQLPTFLIATLGSHQKEPYPIIDEVFWVHEGVWRRVGIDLEGDTLLVDLPAGLREILDLLKDEE